MIARLPGLVILPGFACNFHCDHCITRHRPAGQLTPAETRVLVSTIKKFKILKLGFAGGEPTLYKREIRAILSDAKFSGEISLTSNGHFSESVAASRKELGEYPGLKSVQLSYDSFHAKFLPFRNIRNLFLACRELGIKFSVILSVQSPFDLGLVCKLNKVGNFPIGVQKIIPAGAAKENGLGYKYPVFDKAILTRSCPNKKTMSFLHGYGFSVCCGAPDFFPGPMEYAHPTLEEHLRSRFYRLITKKTFRGIIKALRVRLEQLPPECSDPCTLCEKIFSTYAKNKTAAV